MRSHLRANLWLLAVTMALCSVLYPLTLWIVGQTCFRHQAEGSLLAGADGRPIGSALIAQPFRGDEYFHPRPSAVSYNASASAASNWGASNYLLRDRVTRQLGPLVKYRSGPQKGKRVGPDIERWFQKDRFQGKPGIVAQWAHLHPGLAEAWVKADPAQTAYVAQWMKKQTQKTEPKAADRAVAFFVSFSKENPGKWLELVEERIDEQIKKTVKTVSAGADIQAAFFDMWRQDHPDADLEEVPADLVMTSGSGLDPHITLKGALYQLDRVATAWAAKTGGDPFQLKADIEALLHEKAIAPLGGSVGVPLVNVLEVNLAWRDRMQGLQQQPGKR